MMLRISNHLFDEVALTTWAVELDLTEAWEQAKRYVP